MIGNSSFPPARLAEYCVGPSYSARSNWNLGDQFWNNDSFTRDTIRNYSRQTSRLRFHHSNGQRFVSMGRRRDSPGRFDDCTAALETVIP